MTARRWLLALVVATGLLAMHGITASTASAAAPCGAAVPHEHHAVPASGDLPTASQASDVGSLAHHAGALCLAILVGGLVVGALVRCTPLRVLSDARAHAGTPVAVAGRAPPDTLHSLLCVSRT